jgi:tRNA threonylcarbamoyladenosine biosynthesis protein TsaE
MKMSEQAAPLKISETKELAQGLVKKLASGENFASSVAGGQPEKATVIGLFGDLGAGKTTFMQFFGEALGVREKMQSPTFVIEKIYKIGGSEVAPEIAKHFDHLIHIDAYRLDDSKEILTLGWETILKNPRNIIAIEWADKLGDLLPKDHIHVQFTHHDDESRIIHVGGNK